MKFALEMSKKRKEKKSKKKKEKTLFDCWVYVKNDDKKHE